MAKTKTTVSMNGGPEIEVDFEKISENLKRQNDLSRRYEIRKAKLKDENFLEAEYNETLPDSSNTVKKDCTAAVHVDLKEAFARMDSILLGTCEQPEDSTVGCTGFTIGKDGGGATLIGYRELSTGQILNLTSPYTKFEDNGELEHAINVCKSEVLQYLFEGKHAPDAQMSLEFPDENEIQEEF
jgi:hypothetical protein